MPGTDGNMGRLAAYRTGDMKPVWSFQQRSPFLTGVLSTAAASPSSATIDRVFHAVDVKTGKTLWTVRLGNTVQGNPVSLQRGWQAIYRHHHRPGRRQPAVQAQRHAGRSASSRPRAALYVFALPDGL